MIDGSKYKRDRYRQLIKEQEKKIAQLTAEVEEKDKRNASLTKSNRDKDTTIQHQHGKIDELTKENKRLNNKLNAVQIVSIFSHNWLIGRLIDVVY